MRATSFSLLLLSLGVSGSSLLVSAFSPAGGAVGSSTAGGLAFLSTRSTANRKQPLIVLYAEEVDLVTEDSDERMSKSVDSVRQNLLSIRTGRASTSILDRVKVDYYGVETPVNQMATISVPSAQQLQIEPYDKSVLGDIDKAIAESGLGLTPNSDGAVIRINIPQLTEDRRKDMLKQCKAIGEEGKVAVRNIRRDGVDAIKKFEKSGDIGKDEMQDGLDAMQKLTDKRVKEIDEVVSAKEKEVMTV